jgi:septal ring factor EnvC (AmiA/AmiB activator)
MTMEAMTVREQVQSRMRELQREYDRGEQQLRELVQQEAALRETLLRISGALQVLRELIAAENGENAENQETAGPEPAPAVMTVS